MAVFGPKNEVIDSVPIPIDRRRASRVASQATFCDIAFIFKPCLPVLILHVPEPAGIPAIDDKVFVSVSIPIDETYFPPTGIARFSVI